MTAAGSDRPVLSVIVVTYNSAGIVSSALSSLTSVDGVEVIVVDNASTDDTVGHVQTAHPEARVIESSVNGGFAFGVNRGLTEASGSVVLLLNPDAVISWPDVQSCLQVFADDPSVGIVAPRTVHPEGRQAILDAGRAPTVWRCFTHATGLSRLPLGLRPLEGLYCFPENVHGRKAVDWVSGCCMFLRRSVIEDLSGLTERWFMYAEDIEACLRAGDAGHRVMLESNARVLHWSGASSATVAPSSVNSAWLLNLFDLYCVRHRPGAMRVLAWKLVAVFWMLSRAVAYSRRGRRSAGETFNWYAESRKFVVFARDIWRATRPS